MPRSCKRAKITDTPYMVVRWFMPRNCKRRRLLTLHIWSYGGSCHEVVNGEDYWCSIYGRTVVHATRNKRHKFKSADSLVNAYILCTDILYAWLTILIKNRFYVNNVFCNAQARPPMLNICLVCMTHLATNSWFTYVRISIKWCVNIMLTNIFTRIIL